ncbi:MAG: alpha-amylase family glycosyl hydrolase [Wenzhouxiangellaceae bacterium]|nr:alpha-amylase family glycosyl hydrolase [Wenzhouxiangellaceae bacterium]
MIRAGFLAAALLLAPVLAAAATNDSQRRIEDEIIYFVMPDRFANGDAGNDTGGIEGHPAQHGFDPAHKGFYHGGDLKGLTDRLDYIAGLGATAIWLTPVFVNKPVQGPPGDLSAGYHGYWITNFTDVDPHLGTRDEFRRLVEAAHERNIKIIMDIVVNHTADVIQYPECAEASEQAKTWWSDCSYRSIVDYPYTTRGGPEGELINEGFAGDAPEQQSAENFARLIDPDYAYTVTVPELDAGIKVPAWLNDPRYYHNRGNSHWEGESALYGDFSGLDDVFTEHPRVVAGMLEIYKYWISEFKVDGFRIDTAKHVDDAFWQRFNPEILAHARANGIEDFNLFGESYEPEPAALARFTQEAEFPAVLDFAFAHTARDVITGKVGPLALAKVFEKDPLYQGDARGAAILPTFIGNHDDGRIGHFLLDALGSEVVDKQLLARSILGHALMIFSRGVPVIYYGDEQGFSGDGRDQDAREDMFKSQVETYNDNRLIGTDATTAEDNFDATHPIYRAISKMTATRTKLPALRRGQQSVVHADRDPGMLVLRRSLDGDEALLIFNTADQSRMLKLDQKPGDRSWRVAHAAGLRHLEARAGRLEIDLAALSFAILHSVD